MFAYPDSAIGWYPTRKKTKIYKTLWQCSQHKHNTQTPYLLLLLFLYVMFRSCIWPGGRNKSL